MKLKKTFRFFDKYSTVDISAKVDSVVYLDHRPAAARKLTPCDDWDKADFRWEIWGNGPIKDVAVNVYITGRTIQYTGCGAKIRVKVEFVGDGEPSTYASGWMYYETAKLEYIDDVA